MINGEYGLLVRTSRQFGQSILRGGGRNFRNEWGSGGRTIVILHKKEADEMKSTQHQGETCLSDIQCQVKMVSYIGTLRVMHVIVM